VIAVTFFPDFAAREKRQAMLSLSALAELTRTTTAAAKEALPWLKLARFGNGATPRGSLRHDRNIICITGIEGDYDGGVVAFDEAVERLAKAGLLALVYTSPSHCAERPRWRVLCPTSTELRPAARSGLVSRLNGVLGGTLGAESWTLSQAYYYGAVGKNPDHRVEVIDGEPIDHLDELELIAVGKPATKAGTGYSTAVCAPVDEAALLEQIRTGESYHPAAMRLIGHWASHGVPLLAAAARLEAAFDDVFPGDRDDRWRARRASIPAMLDYVFVKEAEKRADEEQAVYAELPEELRRRIAVGVEGEQRKHEIRRRAGRLVPRIGPYEALDHLLTWNAGRCRPPLPTAEIVAAVEWVAARELKQGEHNDHREHRAARNDATPQTGDRRCPARAARA
jgi:hypothetical protein